MLRQYPPAHERYDEMFAAPAQVRGHWQPVLAALQDSSPASMQHRVETAQRQVRENGITYNVYADPQGTDRPWDLDVLPMILPAAEWAQMEAAVIQRATLMNRILLDVYGPQQLLADGHLPAALVHGHAGFLRPCHGIKHPDGVALHLYAVDLARSADGKWWAIGDRTQAPSGTGYALENRIVIARAFPDLFRDMKVQRLAGFFATMRDSLARWGRASAPYQGRHLAQHEQPLIVLLTPGPYNETYFEQAYLARYLGFPLVHGDDLTVRDGFVWLKTLSGLQRVHVIVRRLDDDYCDPLELRTESALGVAGLTEAARRGTVVIANSLGSNLLESGALLGFLPKLCEHLLGETLLMPSVATWWCGEPAALEDVISRLDRLVFKSSFPQERQVPVFGQDLDASARQAFIARLRADPHNFVAQEMVRVSQAPIWRSMERRAGGRAGPLTGGGIPDLRLSGAIGPNSAGKNTLPPGLGASAVGLRVFACATANGYQVMPGGLTRVATGADARVISMQSGGGSKDTWVLSDGVVDQRTLLNRPTASHDLVRGDAHLASRTVENLFWLGRHSERCDDIARLMRRVFDSLIETTPQTRGSEWPTTLALCQWYGLLDADIFTDDPTIEARLLAAVQDSDTPGLAYQVHLLFRAAFNLRERLSADNWRALNRLLRTVSQPDPKLNIGDALALLDDATASLMTLTGFALDGMTRDMGWRFLSIGRRLERLQFMCTLIQHALTMPADSNLEWLLELGDSIITYRARYMSRPEWLPVLDLLLLDADNPRSVSFQLHGLSGYLTRLETIHGPCGHDLIEPVILQLRSLDAARDLRPGGELLLGLMRQLYDTSFQLSERLSARFLSYSGALSGIDAGSLIKA